MDPISAYISYAPADRDLCHGLVAALHAAGINVWYDMRLPSQPLAPRDDGEYRVPEEHHLRDAQVFIVLVSRAALSSARVRGEARLYQELQRQDPSRRIVPVLIEPLPTQEIWPFLTEYERIEGSSDEPWSPEAIIVGVVQSISLRHPTPDSRPRSPARSGPAGAAPGTALATTGFTNSSLRQLRVMVATSGRRERRTVLGLVAAGLALLLVAGGVLAGLGGHLPLPRGAAELAPPGPTPTSAPTSAPPTATPTTSPTATRQATSAAFPVPTPKGNSPTAPPGGAPTPTPSPTPSPTPTPLGTSAAFLRTDSTTQGNWIGVYGVDGYNVIENTAAYPAYAQVSASGQASYVWAQSSTNVRALEKATTPWGGGSNPDRIAACWYTGQQFSIDVNLTDGRAHRLALYLLDWDNYNGRSETIALLDPATGAVLDKQEASQFIQGRYLVWSVSGHFTIQVTNANTHSNAVVSGLFFG